MKSLKKYLDIRNILFIDVKSQQEAIEAIVDHFQNNGTIPNSHKLYQAILERETIVTTAIGMGIAIPHAKLPDYEDFSIGVAILKHGINWKSIDGIPVRIVILICGPDDKQTEYLQILSILTRTIRNEEMRKKILNLNSAQAIMEEFEKVPI